MRTSLLFLLSLVGCTTNYYNPNVTHVKAHNYEYELDNRAYKYKVQGWRVKPMITTESVEPIKPSNNYENKIPKIKPVDRIDQNGRYE